MPQSSWEGVVLGDPYSQGMLPGGSEGELGLYVENRLMVTGG